MITPKHILDHLKEQENLLEIKLRIWGMTGKENQIIKQKFDPNDTIKDFKGIVLNYTDNKPFTIRFNLDND